MQQENFFFKIINPGLVESEMVGPYLEKFPECKKTMMAPEDVADAVIYALSAPGHVNVQEVLLGPVGRI